MVLKPNRQGFSLVEAMISIVLLGILAVGALLIFYQTVNVQLSGEDLASANNLARTGVEEVKLIPYANIPIDETGDWYLNPPTNTKPNTYDSPDGQFRVIRTITTPESNIKRITVEVYTIDSPGEDGVALEPDVTMMTDIYKYGI
jgi:prepilin-type N-terminal cleavage/methylation domain-containing protein